MNAEIADASVIAACDFRRTKSGRGPCAPGRGHTVLYEPLLLPFELVSVARKKTLEKPEQAGAIRRALALTLGMDMHWADTDFSEVMWLALETGLTTYDAVYLSLARRLGIPLVTFDGRLAAAAETRK